MAVGPICLGASPVDGGARPGTGAVAGRGEPASRKPFAGCVDIGGGRQLYLECRGAGRPTVVSGSGYRDGADVWSEDPLSPEAPRTMVLPKSAAFTRVCAYDRPGTILLDDLIRQSGDLSRSDPVPQPRTAADAGHRPGHAALDPRGWSRDEGSTTDDEEDPMTPPTDAPGSISRRRFLHATAASVLTAATMAARRTPARAAAPGAVPGPATPTAPAAPPSDPAFRPLDDVIRAAMVRYGVPGVAVGVLHDGREYTNGYGVTNLNAPVPVDASTLFQTGSITKTYTATLMMRLVERGQVDLDAPVRRYLPDLALADAAVATRVTVRQLLNHTAGWFGDYFGPELSALQPTVWPRRGDDAVAAYVADMAQLPQLAPLGAMFGYNNAALVLAGRVIEVVTGQTYEAALTEMLLKPLGMDRAVLFPEEAISYPVAAGHGADPDGNAVVNPLWALPRAVNPAGGLILPITEQLTYARFHLGDGTAADGTRLLSPASLAEMRTARAPGAAFSATANAEIYGVGVGWLLERIGDVQIVTHIGTTFGQKAALVLVPARGFAVAVFTNANPQGGLLHYEVSTWALQAYLGLSTPLPATVDLPAARLAEYVGRYGVEVDVSGGGGEFIFGRGAEVVEVAADGGGLTATVFEGSSLQEPLDDFTPAGPAARLAFFRDDAALVTTDDDTSLGADFVRDDSDRIGWLRYGARIQPRLR